MNVHLPTYQEPRDPRRPSPRFTGEAGFSLVELLVVVLVMVVVLGAVYAVWLGLQRTYAFTYEDLGAQAEARAALAEMVELIRTARQPKDPAIPESLDMVIVSAQGNMLECWTDVDRDAAHDLELVRFRVDTATRTLWRDDSETPDRNYESVRLVGNWVSNDNTDPTKHLFAYRDYAGAPLPPPVEDPTSIRQVEIHLLVDIELGKSPVVHELTSVVQPRNLR